MDMINTVGMYTAGVRMSRWAKATEGFPAQSTVRASELPSRKGACNAGSGARPTQKEKAPMAYERVSDAGAFAYGLIPVDTTCHHAQ